MKKRIYSIIEVKNRELNGKILMSIQMANKGYSVVLGKKSNLYEYAKYLRKGIFFFKGMGPKNIKPMKKIKKLGHKIVGFDEEGLVMNMPETIPLRIDKNCLDMVDYFFTVGNIQKKNTLKTYPKDKKKIVSVGNLRFDLMKKPLNKLLANQVKFLKEKYGKFILFPSKFTIINNYNFRKLPKSLAIRQDLRADFKDQKMIENKLLDFFNRFPAKYPNIKILVKSHPVERKEYWEKLSNKINCKNFIYVNDKIPTNAYLLASEFNVGSNCHTSLESYLFGKPTINWRASSKDSYVTSKLIRNISKEVVFKKELEKIIINWFNKNKKFENNLSKKKIKFLKDNLENLNNFTSNNILKYFEMIKFNFDNNNDKYTNYLSFFYFKLKKKIKNYYHMRKTDKRIINFYKAKFDKLDFKEYQEHIKNFCAVMNLNHNNYELNEIYPGCFKIERK